MKRRATTIPEPPVCPRCHKRNGEHLLVCDECGALYGLPAPPIPWMCEAFRPQHFPHMGTTTPRGIVA